MRYLRLLVLTVAIGAANINAVASTPPENPADGATVDGKKVDKGNNGFGNGGEEPAPGNSGSNSSGNSDQKKEDVVR